MRFQINLNEFEPLREKVLRKSQEFQYKYNGINPTKVFLDPKTYLILHYGFRESTYNQCLNYGKSNTIEMLYGIKVEVVPLDIQIIEFGFEENMDTATTFMYGGDNCVNKL